MEKSFVSIEQNICPVCGKAFDTGALLLDSRMRSKMDRHTVTNYGLCPDDMEKFNQGYVALVECDPERSNIPAGANCLQPGDVYRTGRVAHIRRTVFGEVFNVPIEDKQAMAFIDPGVIEHLQSMVQE